MMVQIGRRRHSSASVAGMGTEGRARNSLNSTPFFPALPDIQPWRSLFFFRTFSALLLGCVLQEICLPSATGSKPAACSRASSQACRCPRWKILEEKPPLDPSLDMTCRK
jgi:hypothetical protein